MEKVIIRRFLSVLLCVAVLLYSFAFTSFCVYASGVDLVSDLYDFANDLVGRGLLPGQTDSNGVSFSSADFDKFQKFMTDVHYPLGGEFVSANNEHKGVHLIPTYSTPFFCQPYVVSHGDFYFASSGVLFTDNGYGRCDSNQSSIEAFTPTQSLKYSYFNLVCSVPTESSERFTSYVYSYNDPTLFSNFSPMAGGYSPVSFDSYGFASLSLMYIAYNDITDFGYVIGAVDDIFSVPAGLDSMPDDATFTVPKGALTLSQLTYTIGDDTYSADGDSLPPSVGDDPGNSSGSLGGDITVGGKIDVEGKVDVDVNVNINDGKKDDPNDYIDPGEIDTNLDNYLQYVPDVSKGFIDYLKDFFSWLPPPVFGILMLGLVVAVFCRLTGR